ncbi:CBS domain-containing protein [candidate division GN15 bacterium]|nr:CBS domain-containing protein [candidate division GN15 bacterium]
MNEKKQTNDIDRMVVRDVMIRLEQYPVISTDATLLDAVVALEAAQQALGSDRQPHRAVLVADENSKIVGKIGQLTFLKSLQPQVDLAEDEERLARAGVSEDLLSTVKKHARELELNLSDICAHASAIRARDVMVKTTHSIDVSAPLADAVHRLVQWQQLSLLVTEQSRVVGIIRLSDLFELIVDKVRELAP